MYNIFAPKLELFSTDWVHECSVTTTSECVKKQATAFPNYTELQLNSELCMFAAQKVCANSTAWVEFCKFMSYGGP